MDEIPLSWMFGTLGVLLALSAFFSIAETAMMAFNRYRLKHLVAQGHGGALMVAELLKRTDRLLGGILIGNTVVIAASSSAMRTSRSASWMFASVRRASPRTCLTMRASRAVRVSSME